jgi:epsin
MLLQCLIIYFPLVRNRAKELAELLGDVDLIKAERKKAKKNRNKYTGVGSEGGMSFGSSSMGSGRYEGFGSESNYSSGGGGSSEGGGYGNGGGYRSNDFFDDERPGRYDDFDSPSNNNRRSSNKSDSLSPSPRRVSEAKPKAKTAKDLNLFDFDEPAVTSSKDKGKSNNDDDWGDFADGDGNGKYT